MPIRISNNRHLAFVCISYYIWFEISISVRCSINHYISFNTTTATTVKSMAIKYLQWFKNVFYVSHRSEETNKQHNLYIIKTYEGIMITDK